MRKSKPFTIAFNMLTCATLLAWAKPWPRETISGLVGRKCYERYFVARRVPARWRIPCQIIDWLHRKTEVDHCVETAFLEARARRCLGYHE